MVEAEFQSKILTRGSTPEEYGLYRAALEWDLTEPIVIEGPEDFQSKSRWHERLQPYHHQVTNLITFCRRLPVTLLADDVGLGKTISAGLIVSELISRGRLSKVLVVCPKLLGPQWKEELQSKFDIAADIAVGKDLVEADPDGNGAVITTYNSARLYLDDIPEDRFQMLILDEAHKLRNLYGVEKTPQVAKRFRKALEDRRFRFVLMLTATPIHNRLWDLYSLVDLLTVARGHDNPFGSEGMFARRFIADKRDEARRLKEEAREEFRSIVYGYMSRVRRGDAKLYFPDRVVQMHRVEPTPHELQLIQSIAKPIQKLNRLAQIGILQALTSSPEALMVQLNNMARNGTVPSDLAATVRGIVSNMPPSAKLKGLGRLVEQLRKENPEGWRLVVFTGRRETQTTIQAFLETVGVSVGIINGDSGERNQETIANFRKNPPRNRVIVSTEAGSEGVNLQVANVLVNYDLPWNPMIVEQRIGRVQRLASDHAHVSIFNIMLEGTFEEYIVGRLMEKLQMAAHAIGDIEALLQGADMDNDSEEGAPSFEDRILQLVLSALAGKNVNEETRLAERSIEEAKKELEREEANINTMLGSMDGVEYVGPRAPKLPSPTRSIEPREFALGGLQFLGAKLSQASPGIFLAEHNGGREHIRFTDTGNDARLFRTTLYAPGSPAFERLVDRLVATGVHDVTDLDHNAARESENTARHWIEGFGGRADGIEVNEVKTMYDGTAVLRVRATVAHDSYERLVEVPCSSEEHRRVVGPKGVQPLGKTIEDPALLGLDLNRLTEEASRDEAIAEFSRFYLERRAEEVRAAGSDDRKRKKLQDDFTPRLQISLVGLQGRVHREVTVKANYDFGSAHSYENSLTVQPSNAQVINAPELGTCSVSQRAVPTTCLAECEVSRQRVLKHLLGKSEVSGRLALQEHMGRCALTGKSVVKDELETSSMTGEMVARASLKSSVVSGKLAEPKYFGHCAFTNAEALTTELNTSEFSGKLYRADEQMRSSVSGKIGHKQEFVACYETRLPIALTEAERCDITGKYVRPGVLEVCALSSQRVLPSELGQCAVTGKRAVKSYLVNSSVSGRPLLLEEAVESSLTTFCAPSETKVCYWSYHRIHPDDLRICTLTDLPIHVEFATPGAAIRLATLLEMLEGRTRPQEQMDKWGPIAAQIESALDGGRCRIQAATLSRSKKLIAVCADVKFLLGLRIVRVGAIYDLARYALIGQIAEGKLGERWLERKLHSAL